MADMKDKAELLIDYILVQTILRFPRSDVSIAADLSDLLEEARGCRLDMYTLIVIVIMDFGTFEVDLNFHCSKTGTDRWTCSVAGLDSSIGRQESRYSSKDR